jgi:RNA polymerase sigma-70 factor (ECF subfamily)
MRRREILITSSLEAYLKTALKFQIFKTYRSQQIHYKHLDKVIIDQQIDPPTAEETLDNKMLRKRIYEVAGRMPDKCREVFLLSRYDQLSHKDIAEKLDISVSTVKKHLTKAMNIMRKEFNGHQMNLLAFCVFIATVRS